MNDGPTLDESTIAALRRRIGVPRRSRGARGHIEIVNTDAIRHFALSYGDDNPLYCDPDHAASSVWGGPIAPPRFGAIAGRADRYEWTAEQADVMAGDPLAGMGQVLCGDRWVALRPIRPGADIVKRQCLDSAELRSSTFGGGVGALVSHRVEMRDAADGDLFGLRYLDFWHTERSRSQSAGKYRDVPPHYYSASELAELDALYENEQVRGADTRRWEDVAVGDSLGSIAKGPLTLTDMITYHTAIGWGGLGGGTSKIAYKNRKRVPKLYTPNSRGIPDTAQRCHWDYECAIELGHPAPYDYGQMRGNWMVHLLTNWMGDGGWIWTMSTIMMRFNYLGDSHRISGVVTAVRRAGDLGEVDVDVAGVNQRGETTCRATATLLLPIGSDRTPAIPGFDDIVVPEPIGPHGGEEVDA
jgi:acyl dehydratase